MQSESMSNRVSDEPSSNQDCMDANQTLALWGIQENLLQWYRAIFIAVLAFLTALLGSIASFSSDSLIVGAALFLGIPVILVGYKAISHWKEICDKRGQCARYCVLQLIQLKERVHAEHTFSRYFYFETQEKNRSAKLARLGNNEPGMSNDSTRAAMGTWLPKVIQTIWSLITVAYLIRVGASLSVLRLIS